MTQATLNADHNLKSDIERVQSLLAKLDQMDELVKSEILTNLSNSIPLLMKTEEPKKPKFEVSPEKHFHAALHHATWWAGHQGKYSKTGNHQDLTDANRHLLLSKQHLLKANEEAGHDKDGKETGNLIGDGGMNPEHHHVWANSSEFGHKLLNAAHNAKKDESKTHISGWKISDFGPDGVLSQRKTKATELHDPGWHPLDDRLPFMKHSDYEVVVDSPLKAARERKGK